MPEEFSKRKSRLEFHRPPSWAGDAAIYFITINSLPRGINQLALPETAESLFDALQFYKNQGKWHIHLALLMPDHLHALISFNWDEGLGMMKLIAGWKRFTSRSLGIQWQRDFFDHRVRSEFDFTDKWTYIRENPTRAGLVEKFDEWPYVLRADDVRGW